MQTHILKVDPQNPDPDIMNQAGKVIRGGGLVAFPTETVYGLAADAFNMDAVTRVYDVKGRPADKPLPVQIASKVDIFKLTSDVSVFAQRLIDAFFPGPLTLVLRASPEVSNLITAGTCKIGIRMPNHPVALSLIQAAGTPIVAPSANTSGRPSPINAEEVLIDLDGKIELILDAGQTQLKVASTVIDVTVSPFQFIRQGSISEEMLLPYLENS